MRYHAVDRAAPSRAVPTFPTVRAPRVPTSQPVRIGIDNLPWVSSMARVNHYFPDHSRMEAAFGAGQPVVPRNTFVSARSIRDRQTWAIFRNALRTAAAHAFRHLRAPYPETNREGTCSRTGPMISLVNSWAAKTKRMPNFLPRHPGLASACPACPSLRPLR